MNTIYQSANCQIVLDPNDQFPEAKAQPLLEAGGLLLPWVKAYFQGEALADTLPSESTTLRAYLTQRYGQGELLPLKTTLHPDSHLSYPGGPNLYPLISITQPERTNPPLCAHIYQYGIITIVENDSHFTTRMD